MFSKGSELTVLWRQFTQGNKRSEQQQGRRTGPGPEEGRTGPPGGHPQRVDRPCGSLRRGTGRAGPQPLCPVFPQSTRGVGPPRPLRGTS